MMGFGTSDEIDEEGRNDRRNIQFLKSICFAHFGDTTKWVQISWEMTVLPLKLGKSGFGVRNGFGTNMKVEEIFKTSVSGQNTNHENIGKIL